MMEAMGVRIKFLEEFVCLFVYFSSSSIGLLRSPVGVQDVLGYCF